MKVEARIKFFDIENNKQLRKKGEQFDVTAERGKYLVSMGAAKEVPATKKQATEKPTEQQNNKLEK